MRGMPGYGMGLVSQERALAPAKSCVARFYDRLGPALDLQFLENVGNVVAHRLLGQVQAHRDLGIVEPAGDEFHDLALAIAQLREGVRAGATVSGEESAQFGEELLPRHLV